MSSEKKTDSKRPGCIGCLAAAGVILVIAVIIGIAIEILDNEPSREEKLRCLQDLDCIQDKQDWFIGGSLACAREVERLANWGFEWTNPWPSPKFDSIGLASAQSFRLMGDRVRFQNGFGAWRQMQYTCWYQPLSDTVENVRVY